MFGPIHLDIPDALDCQNGAAFVYVVTNQNMLTARNAELIVSHHFLVYLLSEPCLFSRDLFPDNAKNYVENDAVAALASGTMGKLHGCVLIAGTGCIAYGVTEDGKVARAAGAGPVLGDWGR